MVHGLGKGTIMATKIATVSVEKEIKAKSTELAKSAKNIGVEIHKHLLTIAKHTADTRSTATAEHFIKLLWNGNAKSKSAIVRTDAVKNWLEAFGFCRWGKKKDGIDGFKLNTAALDSLAGDTKEHFKNAASNPWFKFTPEKPYQTFDLDAALKALIKRAKEKQSEVGPNGEKNKVNVNVLAALESIEL